MRGVISWFRRLFRRRSYNAAAQTPRLHHWRPSNDGPNREALRALSTIRARARDLYRNVPYARKAVDVLTDYIVGTGVRPAFRTGDEVVDREAQQLWDAWVEECYPSSDITFYGLQAIAVRAWIVDGEVFVRRRYRRADDGLSVPLQLQVYEADYLDITRDGERNNRYVIGGIEFDEIGRRMAYWLYPEHPGEGLGRFGAVSKAVPADMIAHLYKEERPGQVRGVSWLAPVMTSLWDLGNYMDAERMRKRAEACVVAFVTGGNPEEAAPEVVDGIGQAALTDASGNAVEELYPGAIIHLPPYKDVRFHAPQATAGLREYANVMLHEIASGLNVPYELLTSDLSQVNYSSMRMGMVQFRVFVRGLRRNLLIPQFCMPVLRWWLDACVALGLLPAMDALYRPVWIEPHIEEVDRLREAQADYMELRNGTASWHEVVMSRGKDPDTLLQEIEKERKLFTEKGVVFDSNPNMTTKAGDAPALRALGLMEVEDGLRER